jgi:hypothetical protein
MVTKEQFVSGWNFHIHAPRCAVAVLLEALAVTGVFWLPLQLERTLGLLLLHVGACAIAAPALHRMMPEAQQRSRRAGLAFLFSICFFVPLLGLLGMLAGLTAELYYLKQLKPEQQPWLTVGLPELPYQPPPVSGHPAYSGGALSAILRYSQDPERRLAAVLAARQLRDHNDTEVLRLGLTDSVDDVRLLAYAILDHREQSFNLRLKSFLSQLEHTPHENKTQLAMLHKRLAQTHCEMIHLGLARGEVQSYLLTEARRHIDAALRAVPDDCEVLFLSGRIALQQDELPTAEAAFLKTQELGMAPEKVLPYRAEVAFRQRNFSLVTKFMRALDPFYFHLQPLLTYMAAHWLPEENQCSPR